MKAVQSRVWALPIRSDGQRYSNPPITPPTAIARTVNSATQITLQASGGASSLGSNTGYRYRRNGVLLNSNATASAFADSGLTAATAYNYTATLVDSAGNESDWSAEFSATTNASSDTVPPNAPTISATAASASTIVVSLVTPSTDSGSGLRDYTLQWAISASGPWNNLQAAIQSSAFPITHSGITAATQRFYRLMAFDNVGNSSTSAVVSATTPATGTFSPGSPIFVESGSGLSLPRIGADGTKKAIMSGRGCSGFADDNEPQAFPRHIWIYSVTPNDLPASVRPSSFPWPSNTGIMLESYPQLSATPDPNFRQAEGFFEWTGVPTEFCFRTWLRLVDDSSTTGVMPSTLGRNRDKWLYFANGFPGGFFHIDFGFVGGEDLDPSYPPGTNFDAWPGNEMYFMVRAANQNQPGRIVPNNTIFDNGTLWQNVSKRHVLPNRTYLFGLYANMTGAAGVIQIDLLEEGEQSFTRIIDTTLPGVSWPITDVNRFGSVNGIPQGMSILRCPTTQECYPSNSVPGSGRGRRFLVMGYPQIAPTANRLATF